MTNGRHIVARAVMPRTGQTYAGTLNLFGFTYGIEITKHADGVLITAYDGPVAPGYEIPGLDVPLGGEK
jgi:hypothetical protein